MDAVYMKRALELAKNGIGAVNPNPLVGAVIVKNDRILGEGYHQHFGGAHAEVHAFNQSIEDVTGASMYVTLEPCSHYGKTPPCVNSIIQRGIKKVVVAMEDPNPLVAGRGIQVLRDHGIEVITGVLEKEAQELNQVFIKYITSQLPFCVLKTAMTLDGKIAAYSGDSRWVTGVASRKIVHQMRHQYTGIMVGIGTILADDPLLTTRLEDMQGRNPIRIVVDSHARIPLNAKVLETTKDARTIIATTELAGMHKLNSIKGMGAEIILTPLKDGKVDLSYLMKALGEKKIDSILLEGGSTLNYAALDAGIVDKVVAFIAPKILGGHAAKTPVGGDGKALMRDAILLHDMKVFSVSEDLMIEATIRKEV